MTCALPTTPERPLNDKPVFTSTNVTNGQAISLFRIVFACLLLFDLFVNVLPFWEFLYSDKGVFTAYEAYEWTTIGISFYSYSDNPIYQTALLTIYIGALLGLLLGIRSRLCAFVVYLLNYALFDRNPAVNSNAEVLIICLLFWSCFLPLDRYWSFSSALRYEDKEDRETSRWPIIPILAIKIQIIVVYLYSGLFKLGGEAWLNGQALRYVSSEQYYANHWGEIMLGMVSDQMLFYLAWAVILFQIAFSAMIYSPIYNNVFRALALLGAIAMHTGFILFLQVHMFPYLCFTYLIILIPDRWINAALQGRRERLSKIRIYYDPDCGFCRAVANIFREFCLGPTAPVRPSNTDDKAHKLLQEHNSWVVFSPEGETYLKWEAVAYIMRQSPIFWIFGALTDLPFLKKPMVGVYNLIGDNRHKLSQSFGFFLRPRAEVKPDRTQQLICLAGIIIMLIYATAQLPQVKKELPKSYHTLIQQVGLLQTWNIFAPTIVSFSRHMDIKAYDEKGNEIDFSPYIEGHYELRAGHYWYRSHRLLKYYEGMHLVKAPRHRMGFARYICGKAREDGLPIHKIDMHFVVRHNYIADDYTYVDWYYLCDDIINEGKWPQNNDKK